MDWTVPSTSPTPPQFFVHVIESPSSQDLLDGRTEGRVLIEALALSEVPATYNLVTNRSTLDTAIGDRLKNAIDKHKAFPVIHLSLHGNDQGIALTNGEFLTWHELREILLPINQVFGNGLLVCLSSCYGAAGCRMAMYENKPLPFCALVGHPESATWSDSAIAFVTFYHRISKGATFTMAVEAMKVASGDDRFILSVGKAVQQDYGEYLTQNRIDDFRTAFSQQLAGPRG